MQPIEVGDIVTVAGLTEAPRMVVLSKNETTAEVMWWDHHMVEHKIELPLAVLSE